MSPTTIIVLLVCGVAGHWIGKTSNGMTSPRKAFDMFTGPLCGVIGAVIGLVSGVLFGGLLTGVVVGFLAGLVAGLAGLGLARLQRGR